MKYLATTCFVALMIVAMGCSSSKESGDASGEMAAPMAGSWTMADSQTGGIQFMGGGEAKIDQGAIMTAINRFQNTDRARYITRLSDTATYSYDAGANQLTLNVTADWTGKGTGSSKAPSKNVSSAIVFAVDSMEGNMMTLRKVSMSQGGSDTDNTNSGEDLMLSLMKK